MSYSAREMLFQNRLRERLQLKGVLVRKVHGSRFTTGRPDLTIEFGDYFRKAEIKQTDAGALTPGHKIQLLGNLESRQWAEMNADSAVNPTPDRVATLIIHGVRLTKDRECYIATRAGSPTFLKMPRAYMLLGELSKLSAGEAHIFKDSGHLIVAYDVPVDSHKITYGMPIWPIMSSWWYWNHGNSWERSKSPWIGAWPVINFK